MHYEKQEIKRSYDKFFEVEANQQEILLALRVAFGGFVDLASFDGDSAKNAKAYFESIHMAILDTFCMALMELEVKMLALKLDFENTVDNDAEAVLDYSYIEGKRDELVTYRSNIEQAETGAIDSTKDITGDVSLEGLSLAETHTAVTNAIDCMNSLLENMVGFNNTHAPDLMDFENLLPSLDSALLYMQGVITAKSVNFSETDTLNLPWFTKLADYRLLAFLSADAIDPSLYETMYVSVLISCGFDTLGPLIDSYSDRADVNELIETIRSGKDISFSAIDVASEAYDFAAALALYRSNLKFVTVAEDGAVRIKIATRSGRYLSVAERIKALEKAGAPVPNSSSTLSKLFRSEKGLTVWANGHSSSTLFGKADTAKDAAELADLVKQGKFAEAGNLNKLKGVLKTLNKAGKVVGPVGTVLTVGADIYDSFYDERTASLAAENFDGAELAAGLTVDLGVVGGAAATGAIIGSVVPGLGTAVGGLIGAGIGLAVEVANLFEFGEPPKGILGHAKDGLEDVFEDIGGWFGKVFW